MVQRLMRHMIKITTAFKIAERDRKREREWRKKNGKVKFFFLPFETRKERTYDRKANSPIELVKETQ